MQIEIKMNVSDSLTTDTAPEYIADTLASISNELKSGNYCTGFDYHMYRNLRDEHGQTVGQWRVYK